MKYSQIKQIRGLCDALVSAPAWRDVVEKILSGVQDFEVDGVRFIHDDVILSVLADELTNNEYILGCFAAWCIAEATGWPEVLITAVQKAEAYAEIGAAMHAGQVRKLAEIYSSADGFGHHFNAYDGNEEELNVDGFGLFHVFDNRG